MVKWMASKLAIILPRLTESYYYNFSLPAVANCSSKALQDLPSVRFHVAVILF